MSSCIKDEARLLEKLKESIRELRLVFGSYHMLQEKTKIMMHELIKEDLTKLKNHYGSYRRLSQVIDVSHVTLYRISQGKVGYVKEETYKAIEKCVNKREG